MAGAVAGDADAIPYAEIDCEIRTLVRLLNEFSGIRTEFSCVGHADGQEGYVTFRAESQEAVRAILTALPSPPCRSELVANQYRWRAVHVNAELDADGELRYTLRFSGHPQYVQRQLIGEMEQSFSRAISRVSVTRPSL